LKEHSKCYVTEKRGKVAKKGAFWAQLEGSVQKTVSIKIF